MTDMTEFKTEPHKCPICNGEKEIHKAVLDTDNTSIQDLMRAGAVTLMRWVTFPCLACNQTGIVWSTDRSVQTKTSHVSM